MKKKKFFKSFVFGFVIFVFFILFRSRLDFPLTLDEIQESYTAFSLIETGKDANGNGLRLFFQLGDNFISTLAVFFRIPAIYLFGLTPLGVRIPSVLAGLLVVWVFYQLTENFFKSSVKRFISTFIFSLSPLFVWSSIFDLGNTLSLLFSLLVIKYLIDSKKGLAVFFLLLAILSSFYSLPFLFVILAVFFAKKEKRDIVGLARSIAVFLLVLFLVFSAFPSLGGFLFKKSLLGVFSPSRFTYLIDRRLSFGFLLSSPLVTDFFNFYRISHNKIFYMTRQLFEALATPLDFEMVSSYFQAQTLLSSSGVKGVGLTKFFFWEIPLIFGGLVLMLKNKRSYFNILFVAGILSLIFFGTGAFLFILPAFIIAETTFIYKIIESLSKQYKKYVLVLFSLLFFFSYASFGDMLFFHGDVWIDKDDLIQRKIWESFEDEDFGKGKIIVTDRLGEPVYYYLFYRKIKPEYYFENRLVGIITENGAERIEKVGNVSFSSFRYYEESRNPDEIWVGMGGEFIGKNATYSEINSVPDGVIYKKILGIQQDDKFIGDELWFVKTTL